MTGEKWWASYVVMLVLVVMITVAIEMIAVKGNKSLWTVWKTLSAGLSHGTKLSVVAPFSRSFQHAGIISFRLTVARQQDHRQCNCQ
jgi:galactitol-specific phosphotransferase system IIC component